MAILDFLFDGKPPKSVTTYGETATDTPKWYNDYTMALIAKANAIAAEPYQKYEYDRLASFHPLQEEAFRVTQQNAGAYQPYLQSAGGMYGDASQYLQAAGQGSALSAANPYFAEASQRLPSMIGDYMNPYTNQVVDRIGALSKRQLSENIMPAIQQQFIAGGTFGGSRSGEALGKATRDLQESTLAQQSQALERGYSQAAQQASSDQQRLAQLGQATGALSAQDLQRQLAAGQQMGVLGQYYTDLGKQAQGLGLTQAAALEGIGGQQQAQAQRNLDIMYEDFLRQRDYPRENIAFLNQAIRGLEIPTRGYTETTGPAQVYQPSVLSQLAQAYAAYRGMTSPIK
jgi:hypothetical protein